MGKVTSGQITIIDQNDAKSVTSYITPSVIQQTQTTSEGTDVYNPNWTSTNPQIVEASVLVGGSTENKAATLEVTNVVWTYGEPYDSTWQSSNEKIICINGQINPNCLEIIRGKVELVSGAVNASKIKFVGNFLKKDAPIGTLYYQCTYRDAVTGMDTPTIASASLNLVIQGSNATYIQLSGNTDIKVTNTQEPNFAIITAKLIKVGTQNTQDTSCYYTWYQESLSTAGEFVPLCTDKYHEMYEHFNTRTRLGLDENVDVHLDFEDNASNSYVGKYIRFYGVGNEAATGDMVTVNTEHVGGTESTIPCTIKIHEDAIEETSRFKVAIWDAPSGASWSETLPSYSYIFTVNDLSDPWGVDIYSEGGTTFKNGVGTSRLIPYIKDGGSSLADSRYKGFYFVWRIENSNGNQSAFVAVNESTGTPSVQTTITANTTDTLTVSSASSLNAGDYIKVLDSSGSNVITCEISSVSGNIITLNFTNPHSGFNKTALQGSKYVGGTVLKCFKGDTTSADYTAIGCKDEAMIISKVASNEASPSPSKASIKVTQYDIDVKGTIAVDVMSPYLANLEKTTQAQ